MVIKMVCDVTEDKLKKDILEELNSWELLLWKDKDVVETIKILKSRLDSLNYSDFKSKLFNEINEYIEDFLKRHNINRNNMSDEQYEEMCKILYEPTLEQITYRLIKRELGCSEYCELEGVIEMFSHVMDEIEEKLMKII